jgi:LysM repeat protein
MSVEAIRKANPEIKPWHLPENGLIMIPEAPGGIETGAVFETPPSSRATYIVRAGDTIAKIAKKNGVAFRAIMAANPDLDSTRIKVGQIIVIPQPLAEMGGTNVAPVLPPVPVMTESNSATAPATSPLPPR